MILEEKASMHFQERGVFQENLSVNPNIQNFNSLKDPLKPLLN